MGFVPQSDVLSINTHSINYEFVGHRGSKYRAPRFRIRGYRFGFGNPLSAAICSYLMQKSFGQDTATGTVALFESKLYERQVWLNDYEVVAEGFKDKAVGEITDRIPYYGYIEKAAKVISTIGAFVDETRIAEKQANPYEPDLTSQFTLGIKTTSKAEKYVDYAISYWGMHPYDGPMYVLQRDST